MKWEKIPQSDKKAIVKGEEYSQLKDMQGYKHLYDYLDTCRKIAEQSIIRMDSLKLTDLEMRTKIIESQARVKIYNEIQLEIETAISYSNELKIRLLDQDNGGR